MRRPLSEYSILRPGYERQRRQEYEKWVLQVASFRKSSRQLIYSLKSYIIMRKREVEQFRHLIAIRFRNQ
jgi:hypothetical protein